MGQTAGIGCHWHHRFQQPRARSGRSRQHVPPTQTRNRTNDGDKRSPAARCAGQGTYITTNLDTTVLDVVVTVLRDPFGYQALAMVLPDSFGRHLERAKEGRWVVVRMSACSKEKGPRSANEWGRWAISSVAPLIAPHIWFITVICKAGMMACAEGALVRSECCGASSVCCSIDVDLDGVRVVDSFIWDLHSEVCDVHMIDACLDSRRAADQKWCNERLRLHRDDEAGGLDVYRFKVHTTFTCTRL